MEQVSTNGSSFDTILRAYTAPFVSGNAVIGNIVATVSAATSHIMM